jgi:CheY-like chemotaxis protein
LNDDWVNTMNSGLLLSDDLLFISRITGTARSLGLEIQSARTAADLLAKAQTHAPACVLIDLQNPGLDIAAVVRNLKTGGHPYLVGYGSHVDSATLKAARDAGCDLVLPRSKFVETLANELAGWCGGSH